MTENQFEELLKAAIQEYGENYIVIPDEMRKPQSFSRSFERRMHKMICQERIQVKHRRLPLRQLITIIVAALMILSIAAMSVSAVRDVIIGFITEVYETFTGVRAESLEDAPETLEEFYEVTWVPEGYELVSNTCDAGMCSQLYQNTVTEGMIVFNQYSALRYSANYDNEQIQTEIMNITINNDQGFIIRRNDGYEITWNNGECVFKITIVVEGDEISENEAVFIADSVKKVGL